MESVDYFTKKLDIQLTMNELYKIASALATESFSESKIGNEYNAEDAWKLRCKITDIIDSYKLRAKLQKIREYAK